MLLGLKKCAIGCIKHTPACFLQDRSISFINLYTTDLDTENSNIASLMNPKKASKRHINEPCFKKKPRIKAAIYHIHTHQTLTNIPLQKYFLTLTDTRFSLFFRGNDDLRFQESLKFEED